MCKILGMKDISNLTLQEFFELQNKFDVTKLVEQWEQLPTPEHIEVNKELIKLDKIWSELSLGMRYYISELDWQIMSGNDAILTILSILLYPRLTAKKFDDELISDCHKMLLKMNAFECYKAGTFFLLILNCWSKTNKQNYISNQKRLSVWQKLTSWKFSELSQQLIIWLAHITYHMTKLWKCLTRGFSQSNTCKPKKHVMKKG